MSEPFLSEGFSRRIVYRPEFSEQQLFYLHVRIEAFMVASVDSKLAILRSRSMSSNYELLRCIQ